MKLSVELVHEGLERRLGRSRHILKINADANKPMVPDKSRRFWMVRPRAARLASMAASLALSHCMRAELKLLTSGTIPKSGLCLRM